jgi:hypothetical protein
MPKQMPDAHTCTMCADLMLTTSCNRDTKARTIQEWKDFASSESLARLDTDASLDTDLRAQLETLNPFLTTTFEKLQSNATKGCLLAAYILQKTLTVIDSLKSNGSDNADEERLFICTEAKRFAEWKGGPSGEWQFLWFVEPYRPFSPMPFKADADDEQAHVDDDAIRIALFQTITPSESDFRRLPRNFEYEPGSNRALKKLRRDVEMISEGRHDVQGSFKPSRLISFDVSIPGSHAHVKLVDGSMVSDTTVYAALSYCWGGDQKLKLTKGNYNQLYQNVGFDILPRTLQDAIIVASNFDIRYLWVDALCIVQDDEVDMGRELSVMAQVYQNAFLTISASRAKSVEEGFLQPRLPFRDSASVAFSLTLFEPETQHSIPVICFPIADLIGYEPRNPKISELMHEGYPKDPLTSRAWCFQERALSSRLVEFGVLSTRVRFDTASIPNNMYTGSWKHDETHRIPFTVSGVHQFSGRDDIDDPHALLRDRNPKVLSETSKTLTDMRKLHIYWCSTLAYYSLLKLSNQKDRLPAFSAIARAFAPFLGGEQNYVAGIWKDTLPLGLLWAAYGEDESKDGIPQGRDAPTWSWASISTQVTYTTSKDDDLPGWDYQNNFLVRGLTLDQGLEVLDCKIDLANDRVPFGAVDHGKLRLRGRLRPVHLSLTRSLWRENVARDSRGNFHSMIWTQSSFGQASYKERGLYRRDYQHPNAAFREQRLLAMPTIDRTEDAFETMAAEAKDQLFALPVASGAYVERERGQNESLWGVHLPKYPSILGLLVIKQGNGTYARMGFFRQFNFSIESIFDDYRLEVEQIPELVDDQIQWMLGGELEEFVLV